VSIKALFKKNLARIEAATSGYLKQVGWISTRANGLATDVYGNPIPWFTYPAIQLLDERAKSDWHVLEFGAGMGTLWWSRRVIEVTAIEHSADWVAQLSPHSKAHILLSTDDSSTSYIRPVRESGPYDVVIVDGLYRNECMKSAMELVSPYGVIILDDAQREEYWTGIQMLRDAGYRMLPLHGPQPVSKHPGCTAIFYRDRNVLDL